MSKKPCARCGKKIDAVWPNQKYCEDCRLEIKRESDRYYQNLKKQRQKTAAQKPRSSGIKSISEVAAEARACGMTYGQYMARTGPGGRA